MKFEYVLQTYILSVLVIYCLCIGGGVAVVDVVLMVVVLDLNHVM